MCSLTACHMWFTRNHMCIREISEKFTSFIYSNFEISLVSIGRFQNFKKVNSVNSFQISLLNIRLLVLIWIQSTSSQCQQFSSPENTRKSLFLLCFHEVKNRNVGQKWVKSLSQYLATPQNLWRSLRGLNLNFGALKCHLKKFPCFPVQNFFISIC